MESDKVLVTQISAFTPILCRFQAAASQDHIPLQLTQTGLALPLSVVSDSSMTGPNSEPSALQRVQQVLFSLDQPVSVQQLRKLCGLLLPGSTGRDRRGEPG